jgi:uncharacterized protein involved in exopolysaccharide biosynthesis
METQSTKPLTPKVRAELDGALERQRSLQAGVDALSLDAMLDGKARAKLDRLEGELATATTIVTRLRKAMEQAGSAICRRRGGSRSTTCEAGLPSSRRSPRPEARLPRSWTVPRKP